MEEGFGHGRGAVVDSNPDHLRRVAKEKAALMKIGVVGRTEPNIAHVRGVGVIVLEG